MSRTAQFLTEISPAVPLRRYLHSFSAPITAQRNLCEYTRYEVVQFGEPEITHNSCQ
jgi:hypothetical protein